MQTTTKRDLCEKIARRTDNTHMVVKKTIQMFLDEIISELAQGNRIELRDFGVFEIRQRAARKARNPRPARWLLYRQKCSSIQSWEIDAGKGW